MSGINSKETTSDNKNKRKEENFKRKVSNEINFSRDQLNKKRNKTKEDISLYEKELNDINTVKKRNSQIELQFNQKLVSIEEILRLLRTILKFTAKTFYASYKSINREKLIRKSVSLEKELITVKSEYLRRTREQRKLCEEARFHSTEVTCILCSQVLNDHFCKL